MDNKPTSGTSDEKEEKKKRGIILPLILGILLLGSGALNIWLFTAKGTLEENLASCETTTADCEDKVTEQEEAIMAQEDELDEIVNKYKIAKEEREKLGLDNELLNEKLATLEKNISFLKSQKNSDRAAYEKELAKYKTDVDNYLAQIAELERKADSLGVKTSELTDELAVVNEDKQVLEEQVALGSVLRAERIESKSINKKGKKDDDGEFKAKNIDKMEVTFIIGKNPIAKLDTKEMVLRIIEPTGAVLYDSGKGGHSFEMANGKSDFYTLKQKFKFTNTSQRITFLYSNGAEYGAGLYKVELYCEGHLIGKSAFKVK